MAQLIDVLAVGVTGDDGEPLAGGSAKFYLSGTTTLQTVFQENDLENAHTNPATLDAAGRLIAYTNKSLKIVISDSTGAVVRTYENVQYHRGNIISSELSADSVGVNAINAAIAGDGLGQASDGSLYVRVDDSTIEIATDILRVPDNGITAAKVDETDDYTVNSLTVTAAVTAVTVSATTHIVGSGSTQVYLTSNKANTLTFSPSGTDKVGLDARDANALILQTSAGVDIGNLVVDVSAPKRTQSGTSGSILDTFTSSVTYPVQFKASTSPIVVICPRATHTGTFNVESVTVSGFTIRNNTGATMTFNWIALGEY